LAASIDLRFLFLFGLKGLMPLRDILLQLPETFGFNLVQKEFAKNFSGIRGVGVLNSIELLMSFFGTFFTFTFKSSHKGILISFSPDSVFIFDFFDLKLSMIDLFCMLWISELSLAAQELSFGMSGRLKT
jgi:hypothetical protein